MFHQLHVELFSSNEDLSTFLENFEYTIKKYENSIFYFIGKGLTNGQTETLKIRFGQCFNVIGQLLYNI